MKIIGLTGGIGSGKSSIAKVLIELGYAVYNSDLAAKKAYDSPAIVDQVMAKFGTEVFDSKQQIQFKSLAQLVFSDPTKLAALNEIIHPFVKKDFEAWVAQQKGKLVFKEAAILFESRANLFCDAVISVTADEKIRAARIQKRDAATLQEIKTRMNRQLTDNERNKLADYVINNESELVIPQLLKVLELL